MFGIILFVFYKEENSKKFMEMELKNKLHFG